MRGTINGATLTACTVGFESRPKGFEPFEFLEGLTGLTGFDNCAILPPTASSDWMISFLFWLYPAGPFALLRSHYQGQR